MCEEKSGGYKAILAKEYPKNADDSNEQKPYPELYCDRIILNRCPFNFHTATRDEIDSMVQHEIAKYKQVQHKEAEKLAQRKAKREGRLRRAKKEFGSLQMVNFASEEERLIKEAELTSKRKPKPNLHHTNSEITLQEDKDSIEGSKNTGGITSNALPAGLQASGYRVNPSGRSQSVTSRNVVAQESTRLLPKVGREIEFQKAAKRAKHSTPTVSKDRRVSHVSLLTLLPLSQVTDPSERIMPAFMTKPGYCEHCCVKYEQFHEVCLQHELEGRIFANYCARSRIQHVKSNLHMTYAKNNATFRDLDNLLQDLTRERKRDPETFDEEMDEDDEDRYDGGDSDENAGSDEDGEEDEGDYENESDEEEDEDEDEGDSGGEDGGAEDEEVVPMDAAMLEDAEEEEDDDKLPLPMQEDSHAVQIGSPSFLQREAGGLDVTEVPTPISKPDESMIRLAYDDSVASCASKSGRAAVLVSNDRKRPSEGGDADRQVQHKVLKTDADSHASSNVNREKTDAFCTPGARVVGELQALSDVRGIPIDFSVSFSLLQTTVTSPACAAKSSSEVTTSTAVIRHPHLSLSRSAAGSFRRL